jgi:hypothetical protein
MALTGPVHMALAGSMRHMALACPMRMRMALECAYRYFKRTYRMLCMNIVSFAASLIQSATH